MEVQEVVMEVQEESLLMWMYNGLVRWATWEILPLGLKPILTTKG